MEFGLKMFSFPLSEFGRRVVCYFASYQRLWLLLLLLLYSLGGLAFEVSLMAIKFIAGGL